MDTQSGWLLDPDPHSDWKIFVSFFAKVLQLFVSFFCEKRKKLFAKFSQKYENEHFRFNPCSDDPDVRTVLLEVLDSSPYNLSLINYMYSSHHYTVH
jgi:hypothetical protein